MADIVPTNTEVLVCAGVPLDNKYNDTILFTSAGAQQGYFHGKAKYSYNGHFTYQRVQNKVNNYSTLQSLPNPRIEFSCRIPVNADKVYDCNYLCFCNHYDTNKWWYCFIKEINYINPNCCELIYEIDAIQTFLFDFHVQKSFVEREHTATDNYFDYVCLEDEVCVGEEHLLHQEQLGKDIINSPGMEAFVALCADSETCREKTLANSGQVWEAGSVQSNKANGVIYCVFSDTQYVVDFLGDITEEGKGEECVALISLPNLRPLQGGTFVHNVDSTIELKPTWVVQGGTETGQIYNKMCYEYPFRKIVVVSSNGESYEFHPQNFIGDNISFTMYERFMGDDTLYSLRPNYCQNDNKGKELSLTTAQLGAWSCSAYQTWLAQNKGSLTAQNVGGAINTVAGLAMAGISLYTGNPVGVVMGMQNAGQGIRDLTQASGRIADAKHLPDSVNGKYSNSSLEYAMGELGYWIYEYALDGFSLKRIDNYFTRYGYKVNKIKIPTPFDGNKRPKFNYVKTVDVNITGSVPTPQMNIIKSAFDSGITFWHDANSVGVYGEGENNV